MKTIETLRVKLAKKREKKKEPKRTQNSIISPGEGLGGSSRQ